MENEKTTKKDSFPEQAYREFNLDEDIKQTFENLAPEKEVQSFLEDNYVDSNSTTYYPRKEQKCGEEYVHEEKAIGKAPLKKISVNKKVEPGIGKEAKESPLGVVYEIRQGTSTSPVTAKYFVSANGNEAFTLGGSRDQLRTDQLNNVYSADQNWEKNGSSNVMNIEEAKNPKGKNIESLIKTINPDTKLFEGVQKQNKHDPYGMKNVGNAFESEPIKHSAEEDPLAKAMGEEQPSLYQKHDISELKEAYQRGAKEGFDPSEEDRAKEGNLLSKMYVRGFTHTQIENNNHGIQKLGQAYIEHNLDGKFRTLAGSLMNRNLDMIDGAYKSGNQNSRIFKKKVADSIEKGLEEFIPKYSEAISNKNKKSKS